MNHTDSGIVPVPTRITIFSSPTKEEVLACLTDQYLHLGDHLRTDPTICMVSFLIPDRPKWLVYLLVDLFTCEICGASLSPTPHLDTTLYREISQSVNTVYDSSWLTSLEK